MKKLIIIFTVALFNLSGSAQQLTNIYKKGTVKLIPDKEYASNNDWNKIFQTYYDTLYGKPMGNRKSLKLMPDGSVVVNHTYRNFYTKFSPDGKFEKEFGILSSKGVRLKKIKSIEGVINNNAFFTDLDNMGNMICFNFDGHYIKTLKLDYKSKQIIPLPNGKIAVAGWAIWSDRFRKFVAIVDYETNKQQIIWDHFTPSCGKNSKSKLFNYSYFFEKGGGFSVNTMPYTKSTGACSTPKIAFAKNHIIIARPSTGEILAYDLNGNFKSKDKIEWGKNSMSVEEQKEIQRKAIKKYKNINFSKLPEVEPSNELKQAYKKIVAEMEADLEKITEPIPIPYFSNMIKDSDDNLLFFEFPKEEGSNKFNVWIYENTGKFLCQSSFVCDEYDLKINPSKMVFHNGYIYGLQLLKEAKGVPLRLVRFKLTNE